MITTKSTAESGDHRWRYILSGSVSPPGSYLHIDHMFSGELAHEKAGFKGEWTLQILTGQILMTFDSESKIEDIYTLRNILYSHVSEFCDAVNLVHGTTIEANLVAIHAVREKGNHVFRIGVGGVSLYENAPVLTTTDDRLNNHLVVANVDPSFGRALADFRSALKYASQTGFHCRRAFEALAHSFGPMGEDSKDRLKSIKALQSALNLDETCGRGLLKISGDARHGGAPWITGEERTKWLKLMQTIILRHAEYILATKALNKVAPKFDLLKP